MNPGAVLGIFIFFAVVSGLIGLAIGSGKGRGAAGFWLGFFLGAIGWIIVAVMQATPEAEAARTKLVNAALHGPGGVAAGPVSDTRTCPWCAETIKAAAVVCRFCGKDVEPLPVLPEPVAAAPTAQERRQSFDFLAQEHPVVFDAVWAAASEVEPWPRFPTPALRAACKSVESGRSPTDAVQAAFAAAR